VLKLLEVSPPSNLTEKILTSKAALVQRCMLTLWSPERRSECASVDHDAAGAAPSFTAADAAVTVGQAAHSTRYALVLGERIMAAGKCSIPRFRAR